MKLLFILSLFCLGFVTHEPETTGERIIRPEKIMAFGAVQNATASTFGSTLVFTVSATAKNNLVVLTFYLLSPKTVSSVVDNAGNTYALANSLSMPTTGVTAFMYYGVQVTGGATSVTVTQSSGGAARGVINEYSGAARTNATAFDASTTGGETNSSTPSVSTLTPAATGNLIVAGIVANAGATITAGTDYTLYGNISNIVAMQYRLSSAASETAPFTFSGSDYWGEIATSFNPYVAPTNTGRFFHFFKP